MTVTSFHVFLIPFRLLTMINKSKELLILFEVKLDFTYMFSPYQILNRFLEIYGQNLELGCKRAEGYGFYKLLQGDVLFPSADLEISVCSDYPAKINSFFFFFF